MQLQFKVLNEEIYFESAEESQEYAKKFPGTVVIRSKSLHESPKIKSKLDITPYMILNHLNKHVISQNDAKKDIAMSLYYHALRSKYAVNKKIRTNGAVMLVGSSGSGKTFIIQKACEFMNTLFIHVDTSSMVPEGIVGYTIGDLGKDILALAKNDISRAFSCVVFFDEIDKLFFSDSEHGATVSSQLLRFIEGTNIKITYATN